MIEGRNLRLLNWNNISTFNWHDDFTNWSWNLITLKGGTISYLLYFISKLTLPFSSVTSILGFMLLLGILLQVLSGFYLGWYFIPEPGLVIELREEMFNDTRYGYEIYTLHVRGVDFIFTLSYIHIFKKLYLKNYIVIESDGWILGGYAFFWFHYVVGLGICLSGSHLSDLTLTIAANIYWSLFDNIYKTYYFIFTNKHLNVDQLTRLTILHYFTPWYYIYLIQLHLLFCHEGWDSNSDENNYENKSNSLISWFYDALLKEWQDAYHNTCVVFIYFYGHHLILLTLTYSFFEKWNISEMDEIRFYGVAPHWYFRPLMGILVIAPTHYEGLMWLILFFLSLTFTPVIYSFYNTSENSVPTIPTENSMLQRFFFFFFFFFF